jgi:hypothetical protein
MDIVKDNKLKKDAKILFRFLKDKGVYIKYRKYIFSPKTYNRTQKDNPDWSFEKTLKTYGLDDMITILITWDNTDEGFQFWSDLHEEFKRYVRRVRCGY